MGGVPVAFSSRLLAISNKPLRTNFVPVTHSANRFRRGVFACDLVTSGPQLADAKSGSDHHRSILSLLFSSGSPSNLKSE